MLLAQYDLFCFLICFLFLFFHFKHALKWTDSRTLGGSVESECCLLARGSIRQIRGLLERCLLMEPSSFAEHVTAALHAGKTILALRKIVLPACSVGRVGGGVSALSPISSRRRRARVVGWWVGRGEGGLIQKQRFCPPVNIHILLSL